MSDSAVLELQTDHLAGYAGWKSISNFTANKAKEEDYAKVSLWNKHHFETKLIEEGVYRLELWTSAVGGFRKVSCEFTLTDDAKVLVDKGEITAKMTDQKEYHQFTLKAYDVPCKLQITLSSPVLFKPVHAFGYLVKACPVEEADYDVLPFDLKHLSAEKQKLYNDTIASWPNIFDANVCAANFDNSKAKELMALTSEWKHKSFKQGTIRPFLLLVSMHPAVRLNWSSKLGVNLVRKDYFPDPHHEAYDLLATMNCKLRNVLHLTRDFNYLEMLRKVGEYVVEEKEKKEKKARKEEEKEVKKKNKKGGELKEKNVEELGEAEEKKSDQGENVDEKKGEENVFKEKEKTGRDELLVRCQDVNDMKQLELEELLLSFLLRDQIEEWVVKREEESKLLLSTDECNRIVALLQKYGWKDEQLIKFIAVVSFAGRAKQDVGFLAEQVRNKQKAPLGTLNTLCLVVPTALLFVSPIVAIPAAMLAIQSLRIYFRSTPGLVLGLFFGILAQRVWLNLGDCDIKPYHPACPPAKQIGTEEVMEKKTTATAM